MDSPPPPPHDCHVAAKMYVHVYPFLQSLYIGWY